jgi:hypothetical protein
MEVARVYQPSAVFPARERCRHRNPNER